MKRILWSLMILGALLAGGCGYNSSRNGTDTGGGGGGTASGIAAIDLSASKLTLATDGNDSITFTVSAKTAQNAAAAEKNITVASTGGSLSDSSLTTDADGVAIFTLSVGGEKANRQIVVTLTAGSVVKTQAITIIGTTLTVTANKFVTTPNDVDPIVLTATLKDAASQPINGATISFVSALTNTFTAQPGYAFTAGSSGPTALGGTFKAGYVASPVKLGPDTVTVTASGATATVDLTNNADSLAFFGFTAPANQSIVDVSTVQPLTVTWLDADGAGVAGEDLTFSAGKGYFGTVGTTTITAPTNASGLVTVPYSTGTTAGPAQIIVASTGPETATLTLQVRATTPNAINLQVNPGVVPVSTGTTPATATLKATVQDVNNQAVAGKAVTFSILEGTGGGEFISPVTAITNSGGIATSTFTSGSLASAQDGVVIQASVGVLAPATATMTISQGAAGISIGTTNVLEKVGTTEYRQPFTVVVTNSSGGAVAGAPVTLSLVPIRFYTGIGGETAISYSGFVYNSEDVNRNLTLDPGEDCSAIESNMLTPTVPTDPNRYWQNGSPNVLATILPYPPAVCTGNDRLDPGVVATINNTVNTEANGIAIFYVTYPKSFGSWVDVEITASTTVSGTNAAATIETLLNVVEGDTPYLSSPFGF